MQTIAHNATPNARQHALDALNAALRRFYRMAEPPRHLQYPLVGNLDTTLALARRARTRGDRTRADMLFDLADREYERRERYAEWLRGQRRRSRVAWLAVAKRIHVALAWAIEIGAIAGEEVVLAADRRNAAMREVHEWDAVLLSERIN